MKNTTTVTITTYYTVRIESGPNVSTMETSAQSELDWTHDPKELVDHVRAVWAKNCATDLDITVKPKGTFELYDRFKEEKYYLNVSKKQQRSKKLDIELRVGGYFNFHDRIEYQVAA